MQQMRNGVMDIEIVGEDFFIVCRLTVDGLVAGLVINRRTHEHWIALGLSACKLGSCLPAVFKKYIMDALMKHPLPSSSTVDDA